MNGFEIIHSVFKSPCLWTQHEWFGGPVLRFGPAQGYAISFVFKPWSCHPIRSNDDTGSFLVHPVYAAKGTYSCDHSKFSMSTGRCSRAFFMRGSWEPGSSLFTTSLTLESHSGCWFTGPNSEYVEARQILQIGAKVYCPMLNTWVDRLAP